MDPVTIFGLVCGIVQIVDFSVKVLFTSKELYDRGSLAEHADVDFMSVQLTNLRSDLITKRHENSGFPEEAGRQAILELARRCSQTALELHETLEKLKPARKGSKREAFKKSLKTIRIKRDLDKLGKDLDSYQKALNTKLLINFKYVLPFVY